MYSIKLKRKNATLWINADSDNLNERTHAFDDLGFSVARIAKKRKEPIRLNLRES